MSAPFLMSDEMNHRNVKRHEPTLGELVEEAAIVAALRAFEGNPSAIVAGETVSELWRLGLVRPLRDGYLVTPKGEQVLALAAEGESMKPARSARAGAMASGVSAALARLPQGRDRPAQRP